VAAGRSARPGRSNPICTRAPYNWGDSEAQPGPFTEDMNTDRLVRG
jgi:hypothetical protein